MNLGKFNVLFVEENRDLAMSFEKNQKLYKDFDRDKNTICALSTASGKAGIAVIRVSGSSAWHTVKQFSKPLPHLIESHRVYLTKIFDKNEIVDEVLLTFFSEGKSFTGEETVEISCHGSPYITQKIVNMLINLGCRHADPGEFTYRSFMNGRIDLIQAESILSIIDSQSHRSASLAQRQLQGELSNEIHFIAEELLTIGAHLEAQIDFSEEDIQPGEYTLLETKLQSVVLKIESLMATYSRGRLCKDGVNVVFLGEPNVGKSSLLNGILVEDKAIVTDIAGTTRDVVTGSKIFEGIVVNFFDTAGMRATDDPIEKIGIFKSKQTVEHADIVFWVVDALNPKGIDISLFSNCLNGKKLVVVFNKIDMVSNQVDFSVRKIQLLNSMSQDFANHDISDVCLSALTGENLDQLHRIVEDFVGQDFSENSVSVVSSRQYELLVDAHKNIYSALELINKQESPEFAAFEIKNSVVLFHKIIGKEYDDQIMDRVFSEFCLGK